MVKNVDFGVRCTLILVHSLIHSFSKYLLSIYQVPGTVLVVEHTASNKIKFLPSLNLYSGGSGNGDGERDCNKQISSAVS